MNFFGSEFLQMNSNWTISKTESYGPQRLKTLKGNTVLLAITVILCMAIG